MKDALLNLVKALPNAAANNNTASLDLTVSTSAGTGRPNEWRKGFIQVDVPALSDHTNTSVNNLITLQDSADNGNWSNTSPLIQIAVPGVASTGSVAASIKVPLPPGVRRYIRFNQVVPANGGIGNNANVNYDLVT